jgi:hypothetical protein
MYSLPLKYAFPLQLLRSNGSHIVRLLGGTPKYSLRIATKTKYRQNGCYYRHDTDSIELPVYPQFRRIFGNSSGVACSSRQM